MPLFDVTVAIITTPIKISTPFQIMQTIFTPSTVELTFSGNLKAALVVDPIMVSTSGDVLVGPSILSTFDLVAATELFSFEVAIMNSFSSLFHAFREVLVPMDDTPNLKETAALLNGMQLETLDDMRSAARLLHNMCPKNVLIKGGDLPDSSDVVDILYDGLNFYELRSPRIRTRNTHGISYSLASCIAAEITVVRSEEGGNKVATVVHLQGNMDDDKDYDGGGGRGRKGRWRGVSVRI
ncbi:thiamine biosynthesis protein, putative isoform 3 [Hibiscus syriacus]|uniref:Thiamine biosynthesis protein, putative isoform 3 n=1 Tax=Hibiscus syriacus TaxID=106335 RepID=A0A6A2ZTE6_HIBSY|nr:thiamine biosynthesis protein, putative isoform 3 [Hibiscus syriacus]